MAKAKETPSLKIGTNKEAEKLFMDRIESKIVAFQSIERMAEKLEVKVESSDLYANPYESIMDAWNTNHSEGILNKLSLQKKLELFEVDVNPLKALIERFKAVSEEFNPSTYEFDKPSFDITIEGEEKIAEYKACEKVLKSVKELEKYAPIQYGQVQRATSGAVTYDRQRASLIVNVNRIMNK